MAAPFPALSPADLAHLLDRLRRAEELARRERRKADQRAQLLVRCLGACRAMAALLRLQELGLEQVTLADLVVAAIEGHLRDHGLA